MYSSAGFFSCVKVILLSFTTLFVFDDVVACIRVLIDPLAFLPPHTLFSLPSSTHLPLCRVPLASFRCPTSPAFFFLLEDDPPKTSPFSIISVGFYEVFSVLLLVSVLSTMRAFLSFPQLFESVRAHSLGFFLFLSGYYGSFPFVPLTHYRFYYPPSAFHPSAIPGTCRTSTPSSRPNQNPLLVPRFFLQK